MIFNSKEVEQDALVMTAKLMCAAARTAPKGKGVDNIETLIVTDGPEKDKLITELQSLYEKTGAAFFARDAGNLEKAGAVVLIGTRTKPLGIPACGYCGFGDCAGNSKAGAGCAFDQINLGIALGAAVSVASTHKIDNRIMYTIARAAINIGLFPAEVQQALAIPLFVGGKSPFFDR